MIEGRERCRERGGLVCGVEEEKDEETDCDANDVCEEDEKA